MIHNIKEENVRKFIRRVILSCNTIDQLETTRRWVVELGHKDNISIKTLILSLETLDLERLQWTRG